MVIRTLSEQGIIRAKRVYAWLPTKTEYTWAWLCYVMKADPILLEVDHRGKAIRPNPKYYTEQEHTLRMMKL